MKSLARHLPRVALAAGVLLTLGGCVYGPGYYQRPGVVYDNGSATGAYYDDDYGPGYAGPAYYPGYYYGPSYAYDPWCCYGWPWGVGLGFYGYYGGHHGWHDGGHHGGGTWHGHSGGSHSGHHGH
jgi:hypothetical protein